MAIPEVQLEQFYRPDGDSKRVDHQLLLNHLKKLSDLPTDCDQNTVKAYQDGLEAILNNQNLSEHARAATISVLKWLSQINFSAISALSDSKKEPPARVGEVLRQHELDRSKTFTPSFRLHRSLDESIQTSIQTLSDKSPPRRTCGG